MTRPLKIGFLVPYSGVYPFYGQHLMAGILLGLNYDPFRQKAIQFVPVYTKMGDAKNTLEAVNKLVFFEQVDMVSGLISYCSIPNLVPVLDNLNKLAFFFDMGEYIPWFNNLSPNIFYSSQQIWQSQYALGYWAHKEFGDTGMMVMPVYEAGYHLSSAFHKGATMAGSTQMGLHVLPRDPANIRNFDLTNFFAEIKKNTPSYIHAIFGGTMGDEFLKQWRQSEFYKHIPLTVVENMAYDDVLEDAADVELELYAGTSWNRTAENARNKEFVKKFENTGGQMANIYGLLGYEAGLALCAVKPQIDKRDWDSVKALLRKESITGPRGERNFYPLSGFSLPVIDILKVKTSSKKIYKTVVSQGSGLKFDSENFKEIHDNCVSGWQNPYLCI
jgi:branched-chain amino acid transport system substrate-binding protein